MQYRSVSIKRHLISELRLNSVFGIMNVLLKEIDGESISFATLIRSSAVEHSVVFDKNGRTSLWILLTIMS